MDLISVCISAFIGVFVLLTLLALVMRLIIVLFPEKGIDDSAVIAAVTTTVSTLFPGTKITKIEEIK